MADRLSPERRSWLMSRVRSEDTSAELRVRSAIHRLGFRFRLNRRDLPGKPDLVFPKRRTVLFVHGCFWHRHRNCPKAGTPKTRTEFWQEKFHRNVDRDTAATEALETLGWKVEVVWECETKKEDTLAARLHQIFDLATRAQR